MIFSRAIRLCCFALSVFLGIIGCFLTLDAFIPKEKPVSNWPLIEEFVVGIALLWFAVWFGRKNRLSTKTKY